ncbi:MAG: YihY/virulence factor BrkB family protein [Flavobacteriaceae bacterium]|nr:YihY/virulence factor BrkB family protein [Flavobacteriaceae bacterium]
MSQPIEEKLDKIPVVNWLIRFLKQIKLPGFEGLSIYDLLEMYVIGIVQGALTTRASAIAFSFFTAIFPFLLFVIIIIPYIPFDNFQTDFLIFLDSFLPPQTSEFFNENIFENISKNNKGGLLSTIFLLSLLLMANGVSAVFSGFEHSYHDQLTRNVFKQYLYAFGVAIILALLVVITVGVLGYFEIYVVQNLRDFGYIDSDQEQTGLVLAKFAFYVIMVYVGTATLYFFGTKEGRHSKFFSIGALLTTLLILLTSYLFGLYIENFSKYNELYGSIGALLILLFYLWLNANILLLGFELNVSLYKLRKKSESDA